MPQVGVAGVEMLNGVRFHRLPALAVVQLHPVIFTVFDFSSALESLREKFAQIIVVRGVLETQVPDVAEILIQFLCSYD